MQFSSAVTPNLPLLGVTDDEAAVLTTLRNQRERNASLMELAQAYYLGNYVVDNLRIAIPKELEFLRTILGWPAMAVDPYVERLFADGFIVGNGTDSDERIAELLEANGFAAEQGLAFTDALSMGRCYWMVGTNPDGGAPIVTVESPLNMNVLWDLRGRTPRAALQEYWDSDRKRAALILPKKTVHLAEDDSGKWVVADRDDHGYDFVPVVRMANQATTNNRDGRSAVTPALRSITDTASRTLMGLEVHREFFSAPQMILLGASESDFQKTDGTPKSAWDTYVTKTLALERGEDNTLPDVKFKQVGDPSTFTKILDWCASAAAGIVAATPQDLGLYTQGNPASAEAGLVADDRRNRRARMQQRQFSPALRDVVQMMLRFENKGTLPAEFERMTADWAPVAMEATSLVSDAISKQVAAGAVPPTSDVTLKRLGYSATERRRLEQDRGADDGRQLKMALTQSLLGRANGGAPSGDASAQ